MPRKRKLELVLKPCDTAIKSDVTPKDEDCSHLPASRIKVENEYVENEREPPDAIKGESSNCLIKPAADCVRETSLTNVSDIINSESSNSSTKSVVDCVENKRESPNTIKGESSNSLIKPATGVQEILLMNVSDIINVESSNSLIKPAPDHETLPMNVSDIIKVEPSNCLIKPTVGALPVNGSDSQGEGSYPANEMAAFSTTDSFVKTEAEEERKNLITSELVGQMVADTVCKSEAGNHETVEDASVQSNSCPDREQTFYEPTDLCVKNEGSKQQGRPHIEIVGCSLADGLHEGTIAESIDLLQGNSSVNTSLHLNSPLNAEQSDFSQTIERIKTEVGEGLELKISEFVFSDEPFKTKTFGMVNHGISSKDNHNDSQITSSLTDLEQLNPPQNTLSIKIEGIEEEEPGTSELVVLFMGGRSEEAAIELTSLQENTSMALNFLGGSEQFNSPQTTLFIEKENMAEEEGSKTRKSERHFKKNFEDEAEPTDNVQENTPIETDAAHSSMSIKTEEIKVEEGLITAELVGRLPENLNDNDDTKVPLKAFECEVESDRFRPPVSYSKGGKKTSKNQFECLQCKARFREKPDLLEHLEKHTEEKLYSCSVCPAKFKRNSQLTVHRLTHSSEKRYECVHCCARFKGKKALTVHIKRHDVKVFSSEYRPATFCRNDQLKAHVPSHSSENLYTCAHCSAKLKTKLTLTAHMILHTGEKCHPCPQCPMAFKRKPGLASHLRRHTGEKPFLCQQCPAKYSHSYSLKVHMTIRHSKEKPFRCKQCPFKFSMKKSLDKHMLVHSDERKYCCPDCPSKFKCSFTLKRHLKVHSRDDQRAYPCSHCHWKFKTSGNLDRHVKVVHSGRRVKAVHSGVDKYYACGLCSYKTYNSSDLTKHLVVHSGEKPFACHLCPAKFTRYESLTRHAPRHSNERPFSCSACSKTFKSKRCLQSHSKWHDSKNDRNYSCQECSFTTGSSRYFKAHRRAHASGAKIACSKCPAIFTRKDSFRQHLLVHSDQKPFECAHCFCRFKRKYVLQTHISKLHKEKSSPQASVSIE